jgi:DNA-directed RNA polymerase III subunit RPC1
MAAPAGVLGTSVLCNHVMEVERTLGIEAARYGKVLGIAINRRHNLVVVVGSMVIMEQVQYVMSNYGININPRHTMLMADLMTFKVPAGRP